MTPLEAVEMAAELFDKRSREATPGPWWRPLNTRTKSSVAAELPEGEIDSAWSREPGTGRKVVGVLQCNTLNNGAFMRRRSGRDLEWAAFADPRLGAPMAALLRQQADRIRRYRDARTQASVLGPEWLEIAYNAAEVPQDERIDVEAMLRGDA